MSEMKIGFTSEVSDFIHDMNATKVWHCLAKSCKNNYWNRDRANFGIGCSLQHVYIKEDGKCEQFEAIE